MIDRLRFVVNLRQNGRFSTTFFCPKLPFPGICLKYRCASLTPWCLKQLFMQGLERISPHSPVWVMRLFRSESNLSSSALNYLFLVCCTPRGCPRPYNAKGVARDNCFLAGNGLNSLLLLIGIVGAVSLH